jgi:hypothetical protein
VDDSDEEKDNENRVFLSPIRPANRAKRRETFPPGPSHALETLSENDSPPTRMPSPESSKASFGFMSTIDKYKSLKQQWDNGENVGQYACYFTQFGDPRKESTRKATTPKEDVPKKKSWNKSWTKKYRKR